MFELPKLDYGYGDLKRSMSEEIMTLHHQRHHKAYIDKLNQAIKDSDIFNFNDNIESILKKANSEEFKNQVIVNNGGGYLNHKLFWDWMTPNGLGEPTGYLKDMILNKYGTFQNFIDDFSSQAVGLFGSGWTWLLEDGEIVTTQNQDNPEVLGLGTPILGLDVWEHAYYLDYKNVRADYIKSWWEVVNWEKVQEMYNKKSQS